MKFLDLETYKDFKCIGSDCPFTCCGGGWRIIIDPETDAYYKTVEGEMGRKLEENIVRQESGQPIFKLTENGDCPFLNEKKLCDIYSNLGEEHLCYTCTTYPRYTYVSGDIFFSGVSISCPEVARFFLTHKDPLQIDFAENKKKVQNESGINWGLFNQSIRVFTTAISIVQNRELSVRERLAILTLLVFQYQTHVDEKKDSAGIIELFGNASYYAQILSQTGIEKRDIKAKIVFCIGVMSYFSRVTKFESHLPELAELVRFFSDSDNSLSVDQLLAAYAGFDDIDEQIWQEQVLTYTLFRYFMQGFDKGDFYNKFVVGVILIYEFCVATIVLYQQQWQKVPSFDEQVMIIAHISRLVEHDPQLMDTAIEYFKKDGMTDPYFVLKLIS